MKIKEVLSNKWIIYSIILILLITNTTTVMLLLSKKDVKETVIKETVVKETVKVNKSKTEAKPVSPRKINLSKFVSGDTHEVDYSDLNGDGIEEIVIIYCTYNKYDLPENSYIMIIGWDGHEYKRLCKSKKQGDYSVPHSIEIKDVNNDKQPEIVTNWSTGAHSTNFYISKYSNGKIINLGAFFGTNGVSLMEDYGNKPCIVEASSRDYDDVEAGDSATTEVYKWNGKKYVLYKTYKDSPVLTSRKEIPNSKPSAIIE